MTNKILFSDPIDDLFPDIYFEELLEEDNKQVLDFDNIQEITREHKNKKLLSKKEEPKKLITISPDEEKVLNSWMKDLEKYIVSWALEGKNKLYYDCSKVDRHLFFELAKRFKMRNPKFYLEYHCRYTTNINQLVRQQ